MFLRHHTSDASTNRAVGVCDLELLVDGARILLQQRLHLGRIQDFVVHRRAVRVGIALTGGTNPSSALLLDRGCLRVEGTKVRSGRLRQALGAAGWPPLGA